jgi:ABC-type transport system involved in multi-copper enzyme maturation permease subunit
MPNNNHRALPTDFQQIGSIAKYEVYKYLRSRRLVSVVIIEAIVITLILAIPPLLGRSYAANPADFTATFAQFTYLLAIISATMFAGDALVSEFQQRTGYLIFPNPVKRWVFFAGKLLASLAVVGLVLVIYYAVAILAGVALTGSVSDLQFASLGLAYLFGAACVGIAYLLSSVMKTATSALVFTFFLLFLILPIVDGVGMVAGARTDFSLTFQEGVIPDILQTPYPSDHVLGGGPGPANFTIYQYVPHVDTAIIVMSLYLVVSIAIAVVMFNRREMLG